jgi:hypothetical protein
LIDPEYRAQIRRAMEAKRRSFMGRAASARSGGRIAFAVAKRLRRLNASQLGNNTNRGHIVMRMSSLQSKKASISNGKARCGARCLKRFPHGMV